MLKIHAEVPLYNVRQPCSRANSTYKPEEKQREYARSILHRVDIADQAKDSLTGFLAAAAAADKEPSNRREARGSKDPGGLEARHIFAGVDAYRCRPPSGR
ncbi:hypothetical protein HPB50_021308 [Hyalomma asiaticum]|uniref:Uncharacterized protein n=1 Tax=Hyalomma asiaticum TaxID=266040 RepID=A0ACB7SCX5_HYAAI|nr:hypothetical protein HPB50_021308 [Hyalomma asiaticum]